MAISAAGDVVVMFDATLHLPPEWKLITTNNDGNNGVVAYNHYSPLRHHCCRKKKNRGFSIVARSLRNIISAVSIRRVRQFSQCTCNVSQ